MISCRTSVGRVAVALAAVITFALAAAFGVRPQLASHRGAVVVASAAAARMLTGSLASPPRELRASKPVKVRSLVQAQERAPDRLGPADAVGPVLPSDTTGHAVGRSSVAAIFAYGAYALGFRQRFAVEQHPSRAPPRFV